MPGRRNQDGSYMAVDVSSDESLVADDDDQDFEQSARATRSKGKGKATKSAQDKGKGKAKDQSYAWEAVYQRSWDDVQEDESGNLQGAVDDLLVRSRRRRLLAPSTAIRRSIIRHLVLTLDLSLNMMDRDLRPSRFDLTLEYAREFITEWFDQNPLGQMAIVGMRAGVGERIGEMSGNPQDLLNAISDKRKLDPDGEASLQNAINMARGSMSHLPTHSSREVLVIFGSLTTVDPGNIHDTVADCVQDKIVVSFVALAAELKICRDFSDKTGGKFGVAMNEGHFKDLMFELVPPPAHRAANATKAGGASSNNLSADLMMMGFPTRLPETSTLSLCACHSKLTVGGYLCPRCLAKLCDVPTDCDICGLMIVSSPHLARSYHHLFPVKPYRTVTDEAAIDIVKEPVCHACAISFKSSVTASEGVSPFGRYRCPDCSHDFCADCDSFVHEVVHVCPSCHDTPSRK